MELSDSSKVRVAERESASGREALGGSALLYLRLWSYSGPSQPLKGFVLHEDEEIAQLIDNIISQGKGEVTERRPEILTACFGDPLQALATAKTLQQRFLTFHRKTEPQQVVPSVLISSTKAVSSGGTVGATGAFKLLTNGSSAQILVSELVYEAVKNSPGVQFSRNPVRESGGTGGPDAIHELLWTDESTYGHLRKSAGRNTSKTSIKTVGRYQLQEELGRGAMGVVYKAYDELIGRTVALKTITINRNAPDHDELVERLKQEAKAAGMLDHPNIITIYDVGQEGDLVYLSMQFIEGRTLSSVLADGSLPALPTLFSWADQILSAVDFAHACGVIHRDLKPANLMLTTQGVVKILDFGIAKIENATMTQTGLVVGTPSYMAPEQISGKKVDHRADIFALGSVFYELVTREKPFRGDVTTILYKIMNEEPVAPSLINPSLPGGIDAIIRKALAKDPDDRFQSCDEMRTAFLKEAQYLKVAPGAAAPVMPAPISAKPVPKASASPHYLLEELTTKQTARNRVGKRVGVVAAVLLVMILVFDWAYITKSRTGSFPPLVAKIVAIFHPAPVSQNDVKPEASPAVPPNETDSSSSPNAPSGAVANSSSKTNSADSTTSQQPANTETSSSSGVTTVPQTNAAQPGTQATPQPAPLTTDKTQPATDPSHSPTTNTSATPSAGPSKVSAPSTSAANQGTSTTSAPVATNSDSSKPVQPGSDSSSSSSRPAQTATVDTATSTPVTPVKKVPQPPAMVDGFSRKDVPELLRQAEAASGRGDYRLAKYSYNLILKLEPSNAVARAGLRRVQAAEQAH